MGEGRGGMAHHCDEWGGGGGGRGGTNLQAIVPRLTHTREHTWWSVPTYLLMTSDAVFFIT